MHLGTRRIRSAGRTSGSIEITLPALLQGLKGVNCQLIVRDGPRPEIVLQPDLSAAQDLFQRLWQKIQLGLGEIGELPEFSLANFTLTFFPIQSWQERPSLAYTDALAILQQLDQRASFALSRSHENGNGSEGDMDAFARLLASLAVAASYPLGLQGRFALAFGDGLAYLVTGSPTNLSTDFERGMAHRLFWGDNRLPQPFAHPFKNQEWQQARMAFRRVFDQFHTWQETPATCSVARDQWYRALALELKTI